MRHPKVIICPKCKKLLKDALFQMMGIDKKCFACHVCWTKKGGFKVYPPLPENK